MHVSDGLAKESVNGFCFWRWSIYNDLQTYLKLVCNSSLQLKCHNVDTKTYIFFEKNAAGKFQFTIIYTLFPGELRNCRAEIGVQNARQKRATKMPYIRWIWRCWAMLGTRIRTFSVQTSWNLRVVRRFVETYLKFHVPKNCATNEGPGLYNSQIHKSTTSSIKYAALLACRICRIVEIHWPIDTQKWQFHEETMETNFWIPNALGILLKHITTRVVFSSCNPKDCF
jgi:hypothetical protein